MAITSPLQKGPNLVTGSNGRQLVLAGRKPIEHLDAASLSTWFHVLNEQAQLWQARFAMLDQDINHYSAHNPLTYRRFESKEFSHGKFNQ